MQCHYIVISLHLYIYTLTGHFIRYTLLVLGWTPFCLQNCLNSSRHRFNKVLETFLRDFGPYWHDSITQLLQICRLHIYIYIYAFSRRFYPKRLTLHSSYSFYSTSMMQISRSTTSQRCSIRLRSGDCGGHLSKVNSLSCSRNQSEMIWALWHGALSCCYVDPNSLSPTGDCWNLHRANS